MKRNIHEIPVERAVFVDSLWPGLWAYFNEFRNKNLRNPNWLRISRHDWYLILKEDCELEHMSRLITGAIAVIVDPCVKDGMPIFE